MSILKNAVETIQIGLEDYENKDPRRSLSAIRNISAGILLLFKEKLRELSPEGSDEVFIKKDFRLSLNSKRAEVTLRGVGDKTVDVYQIQKHFKDLDIKVDWEALNKIISLRNNIEHYYTDYSSAVINEIVSKSFVIIRDFCNQYLERDPVKLFGPESWGVFLRTDEFYKSEIKACRESLNQIEWTYSIFDDINDHIRCPKCQSELVMANANYKYTPEESLPLKCRQEGCEFEFEEVVEDCVYEILLGESYIAETQGGDYPYGQCPKCGKATYVYSEKCCVSCGYESSRKNCLVCGNQLDMEEAYEGGLCSYHRSRY